MLKNFKSVERCVYGRGSIRQLGEILMPIRSTGPIIFLVDASVCQKDFVKQLPVESIDELIQVSVQAEEPTTRQIDELRDQLRFNSKPLPGGIVGIGGGSVMDIAKALALMLTHDGSSSQYQGLNLIQQPGVWHCGVPTLAGTGAEVSMTAVLTGPTRKLGLKSDYTVFDQIILDPDLIADVPDPQRFYTGMDCYIHCIESLNGYKNNAFSTAYGLQALELCRDVFLSRISREEADEKLMVASYFGGLSLTYSEVGACHALSYGLSYVLHLRHGVANCIAFRQLREFYPEGVHEFELMCERHQITIPDQLAEFVSDEQYEQMAETALSLPFMWAHALGENWMDQVDSYRLIDFYRRMQHAGQLYQA